MKVPILEKYLDQLISFHREPPLPWSTTHRLPLHLSENENAELLAQLKLSQRLSEEAAGEKKMSKVVKQHTELEFHP